MKFWAASGKTDNCKNILPNFHSQLHCETIKDTAETAKLAGVCVKAHVGMGSTTFSSSQGNLVAWRTQESKEQMLLTLSAHLFVAGLFPSWPITWACSHLREQTILAFINDIAHDAWRRLPEVSSHPSAAHLALPMKKGHGDANKFGQPSCCAAPS